MPRLLGVVDEDGDDRAWFDDDPSRGRLTIATFLCFVPMEAGGILNDNNDGNTSCDVLSYEGPTKSVTRSSCSRPSLHSYVPLHIVGTLNCFMLPCIHLD
jgi:hypothetical protein